MLMFIKKYIGKKTVIILTSLIICGCEANAVAADFETLQIGGVGNVRFMDQNHGYASSGSGPFAALSFEVTSMEPQADGSIIAVMKHDFLTPTGGWLKSVDEVIMVPVSGSPNIFSLQVRYDIVEAGGGMEGFEGQFFESRGFVNMNTSIASVRYKGSISRIKI